MASSKHSQRPTTRPESKMPASPLAVGAPVVAARHSMRPTVPVRGPKATDFAPVDEMPDGPTARDEDASGVRESVMPERISTVRVRNEDTRPVRMPPRGHQPAEQAQTSANVEANTPTERVA